jgi:uncharacterized protein (TIGR02466 family)
MTVEVFSLFPTPIYITHLNRVNTDIIDYTEKENFQLLKVAKNGYRSTSYHVLDDKNLKELKDQICDNINTFVHDILKVDNSIQFCIKNSWIMKHKKGNWAQYHTHNNCLLTGIYYYDVENTTGDVTFRKKDTHLNIFPEVFDIPFTEENMFNTKSVIVTPENNKLIIFPSHLLHKVSENMNDKERHCLVFNVFIRGTLGSDEDMNRLDFK